MDTTLSTFLENVDAAQLAEINTFTEVTTSGLSVTTRSDESILMPASTQAPTQAPTQAATQAPTYAPTRAPTQASTEAPTQASTQAPTQSTEDYAPDEPEPQPY